MHYITQSEVSREVQTSALSLLPFAHFPSPLLFLLHPSISLSISLFSSSPCSLSHILACTHKIVTLDSQLCYSNYMASPESSSLWITTQNLYQKHNPGHSIWLTSPTPPLAIFSLLPDIQCPEIVSYTAFPLVFYSWNEGKHTTCYSF